MISLIVGSTEPYSGKSGVCLTLLSELKRLGKRTAYIKPLGTMPVMIDDVLTDQDAAYVSAVASVPAPLGALCPVVETRGLIEDTLSDDANGFLQRVLEAHGKVSVDADVVIVEGPGSLSGGRSFGLDLCALATALDARVLLVDKPAGVKLPDKILYASDCLGQRLFGVLFNAVDEASVEFYSGGVSKFLGRHDVRVFGTIPHDPLLSSVTVEEIVEALGGTVLSAEDAVDEPVESFMVGAMGQDKALRYFRRRARKAVITGGDRSDVQLAALETDTRCIILTGNLPPSSLVLARADELGVPMVLVGMDTLSAVEKMEALLGRVRVHDPRKADRIRQMFREAVDIDSMFETLLAD